MHYSCFRDSHLVAARPRQAIRGGVLHAANQAVLPFDQFPRSEYPRLNILIFMDVVFLHQFWRALQYQMPCITAYLVGMVLVLYYRRRFPGPCLFVFLGCCLKMVNAVAYSAAAVLLAQQQDFASLANVETAVGLVDALGYGLLFLAVFHGRKAPPPTSAWHEHWDEDDEPAPASRPLPSRDQTDLQ